MISYYIKKKKKREKRTKGKKKGRKLLQAHSFTISLLGMNHRTAVRSHQLFLMKEEVLCCSEIMRSLQIVALALGNCSTRFFPYQIQENIGRFPKRRVVAVKNGGCSIQSPNTVIPKRNGAVFSQLLVR